MIILYTYLAIGLLIIIWLGWNILFRVDPSDWLDNRLGIGFLVLVCSLLWPLYLFKPRSMIDPSTWLFKKANVIDLKASFENRQRELELLSTNPPPCGSVIRYRQRHGRYEETFGEFLYNAEHVEQELEARLQENPHLVNNEEGAILNWIQHRDASLREPTDVPEPWYRFQYTANVLTRTGQGKIRCLKCNSVIDPDTLVRNDDRGRPGYNFDRLVCPSGHNLLVVDSIHLCITR